MYGPQPADVLVLQRVTWPNTVDVIRDAQQAGTRVVYDIDDWYDGIPDYNPAAVHAMQVLDLVHDAMQAADVVTCSTPELAEGYAHLNRTVVLPNYLDPDLWSEAELAKYRPEKDRVHVGWAGNIDYRTVDLDLLRPWLPGWLDDNPQVRFVAVGGPDILDYLGVGGLASPPTEHGNYFRPYDHLPALLTWLDVGLVPLEFNRFNQAKSWCKGMEYNAAGAAVVASPSREYRQFVQPGVNGQRVRKNDWRGALDTVLDDLDGFRARARRVAEQYLIDRHIGRWEQTFHAAKLGLPA
jgi:glycosyltransferase involved in cell wall biosynthesis